MAWAPDYVTLAEQKAFQNLRDETHDVQVALAITAASRAIDRFAGRQFGKVAAAEERVYTAVWDRRLCSWIVTIDDLQDTTGMTVTTAAGEVDDYTLEPRNAVLMGKAYTQLVIGDDATNQPTATDPEVTIEAPWGWTATPASVKLACHLQTNRFMHRRDSPWGVAGSPDLGNELRLLDRVDPDVAVSLADYRRRWGAV